MSEVVKLDDGKWWIVGAWGSQRPIGPYDAKTEAESDRVGLNRSYRNLDDERFWTTE